jgi:hypothetical protein
MSIRDPEGKNEVADGRVLGAQERRNEFGQSPGRASIAPSQAKLL